MKKPSKKLNIIVLISGNGSNLQAMIDAIENHQINVNIQAVISNKANAYGLTRAQSHHIPTHVIDHRQYNSRGEFEKALIKQINHYQPHLIALAGFMRILSTEFVHHYPNQIINIHPSLLPKYPGLHTHQQVLLNQDKQHGCTIHFVTEAMDAGPIIGQSVLNVLENDTEESLQNRVHILEHELYPKVLQWFAEGKINPPDA